MERPLPRQVTLQITHKVKFLHLLGKPIWLTSPLAVGQRLTPKIALFSTTTKTLGNVGCTFSGDMQKSPISYPSSDMDEGSAWWKKAVTSGDCAVKCTRHRLASAVVACMTLA